MTTTAVTAPEKQVAVTTTKRAPDPIKMYLRALKTSKTSGRPRTEEAALKRITDAQESLAYMRETGNVIEELRFAQKILNLQAELRDVRKAQANDPSNFEAAFVKHAAKFAKSHGISRAAWRRVGVTPDILNKAGL